MLMDIKTATTMTMPLKIDMNLPCPVLSPHKRYSRSFDEDLRGNYVFETGTSDEKKEEDIIRRRNVKGKRDFGTKKIIQNGSNHSHRFLTGLNEVEGVPHEPTVDANLRRQRGHSWGIPSMASQKMEIIQNKRKNVLRSFSIHSLRDAMNYRDQRMSYVLVPRVTTKSPAVKSLRGSTDGNNVNSSVSSFPSISSSFFQRTRIRSASLSIKTLPRENEMKKLEELMARNRSCIKDI